MAFDTIIRGGTVATASDTFSCDVGISGGKVNPLIGAAGISAFPMAARVVQRVAQDEDFENFLLMHAMGANAAGQVASVVAGGVVLALMGAGG